VLIPVGYGQAAKLWVVAGALGFSRFAGGWMVLSRAAHGVLGAISRWCGSSVPAPRKVVWGQEGCISRRQGGQTTLTDDNVASDCRHGRCGVTVTQRRSRSWRLVPRPCWPCSAPRAG
jgi:hypothetical protein